MKKRKNNSETGLRPHYDFDELEVVAYGPGWGKGGLTPRTLRRYYASRLAAADPLFAKTRLDRELLADFFMTFARTEYALKRAQYFRGTEGRPPTILWDKFAKTIAAELFATKEPAVRGAIDYLAENPPRKQVVKGHELSWESPQESEDPSRDAVLLIKSVRTVRSNLFHGGKEAKEMLAERDRRLLISCLNLLSYAVSLEKDVLHFFVEHPAEAGAA